MKRYFLFAILVFFITVCAFAQEIGRVEVGRNMFVVFAQNGSRISSTNIGTGSHTLIGWGNDFFVVRNGDSLYSHDSRGRRIAEYSPGVSIARALVYQETVIVFSGEGNASVVLSRDLRRIQ